MHSNQLCHFCQNVDIKIRQGREGRFKHSLQQPFCGTLFCLGLGHQFAACSLPGSR